MANFFVSYTQADERWASWIAWHLQDQGYDVILQAWHFLPGADFVVKMQEALARSERVIVVVSPDYLNSPFGHAEWGHAFAKDPEGKKGMLVPVLVRETELPPFLATRIHIRLAGVADSDAARGLLLDGVRTGPRIPSDRPVFPGERAGSGEPSVPQIGYPGALPAVWNLPHPRNRNFTGRRSLLHDVRARLTAGTLPASTVALHGLPGIGKTQAAREYCYLYASEYDLVWWVDAQQRATLALGLLALARELKVPADAEGEGGGDRDPRPQAALLAELAKRRRWLLVLDDADGPEAVRHYLPSAGDGHVLITSSNPNWLQVASPAPVLPMTADESRELLCRRSGRDEPAAAEIAEELAGLPLAINLAGAYVEAHHLSLAQYLVYFRQYRQELLDKGAVQDDEHGYTLRTVWKMAFEGIAERSAAGAQLLDHCAFLRGDGIPLRIFRAGAKHLPPPLRDTAADDLRLEDALSVIRRYSLLERREDAVSLHPLVQEVRRNGLGTGRAAVLEGTTRVVLEALPQDLNDLRLWPALEELLPQAGAVARHCLALKVALEAAVDLHTVMGRFMQAKREFHAAEDLFRSALAVARERYGLRDTVYAHTLNHLGTAQFNLRSFDGAERSFREALHVFEGAEGLLGPNVAVAWSNLAQVARRQGDERRAEDEYLRGLRILREIEGPEGVQVAAVEANLAVLYRDTHRPEKAKWLLVHALRIFEARFGPDHPNTAIVRGHLQHVG
jgi:tetratricopeptide (TPR) repeat protein